MNVKTLEWISNGERTGYCNMVEQTLLPNESVRIDVKTVPDMSTRFGVWPCAARPRLAWPLVTACCSACKAKRVAIAKT